MGGMVWLVSEMRGESHKCQAAKLPPRPPGTPSPQSMAARAAAAAAARGGQASDHVEYLVASTRPDHMGRVEGHDDLGAALMG